MGHQKRFCTKCFSLYNGGRDACCGQDTLNIHAEAKFPPKYNGNLTKEWKNFIGSYVFMKSHLSYDDNKKIYDFLKKLGLLEKTGEIFFQKLTLENEKKKK